MPLEEPPRSLEGFPELVFERGATCSRIHRAENDPLFFSTSGAGRYDLSGKGTLYLAAEEVGAFLEVFRSRLVPAVEVAVRRLAVIGLRADLRLADLTSPSGRGFGVTAALQASDDYGICQRWASALHGHGFAGLTYRLSHDPSGESLGVALFGPEESIRAKLEVIDDQPIAESLIDEIRARFGVLVLPVYRG